MDDFFEVRFLDSQWTQGRVLSFKTFFMWLMISVYQGRSS
jgi:hypothetical protein